MKKLAVVLVMGLTLGQAVSTTWSEEVPRDQIERAIEIGCQRIMSTQREDGAFILSKERFHGVPGFDPPWLFPVGVSSLGTLALQHALPNLKGQIASDARQAVQKSLDWALKQQHDPKTYSAGVAICMLYTDNPQRHAKLISEYAAMLITSQHTTGREKGHWSYDLYPPPGQPAKPGHPAHGTSLMNKGDHSNDQYAVLGLLYAHLAGFQIPAKTWTELRQHYVDSQKPDGGWAYGPDYKPDPTLSMTLACTVSLQICEEMLYAGSHKPCQSMPMNPSVARGLEWLATNLDYTRMDTYGMYATERLGILMGLSELGGKPWFDEGARILVAQANRPGAWRCLDVNDSDQQVGSAFAVLFLSRGLEPVIINKLKRGGTDDWNNDTYDIKHLTEYVSTRFQIPKQWRIVSLEANVEFLKRTPILFISGHDPLTFTTEEKSKLKDYVEAGGTIFGMACCSSDRFRRSFTDLVKELWPEREMVNLPKTHPIYTQPRPTSEKPLLLGMEMPGAEGRLGVILSPGDLCCRWHVGGTKAKGAYEVGANLTFYVEKMHKAFLAAEPVPTTEPEPQPVTSDPAILGP